MKIYLAAIYSSREKMIPIAEALIDRGHSITSRWIWNTEENDDLQKYAVIDFEDVKDCNLLIQFTHPPGTALPGGGRHTEFGMAYALGKLVAICGPREQIFHSLPQVNVFFNVEEMLNRLDFRGLI